MELPDRQRLDRLSDELAEVARQVRAGVAGIRQAAANSAWHSPAAHACAQSIELVLGSVLRLAAGLDGTAGAVSAHGRRAGELAGRVAHAATADVELAGRATRMLR